MSRLLSVFLSLSLFLGGLGNATAEVPPFRAATKEALQAVIDTNARFEDLGNGYALVTPAQFAPLILAVDPIYKNTTHSAVYVFEKENNKQSMLRRVIVHFEPDDRDAAIRTARLVARLLYLHRLYLERDTVFPRTAPAAQIWFTPASAGFGEGGETRDANIYVFAASTIRTPIELIRTIAHEWGHLTLPAARGYASPESDAAGYLGERLYMNYLLTDQVNRAGPFADDGTTNENLRLYYDRQIAPLEKRWQTGGPNSKVLDGDQTEAMDYYIAGVLEANRAYGPKVTGEALFGIDDTTPRAFLLSLKRVIVQRLPGGLFVAQSAWLPLDRGQYRCKPVSGGGVLSLSGPQSLKTLVDGPKSGLPKPRPNEKREGIFRVTKPGWFHITPIGSLTEYTIQKVETAK